MAHKPTVEPAPETGFDIEIDTLIIGAGACGLIAALSATEAGQSVLVVEADAVPSGSTALSAGLIPAAGTRLQSALGIDDCASRFAADIQSKSNGENNPLFVSSLAAGASEVIHWLMDSHSFDFSLSMTLTIRGIAGDACMACRHVQALNLSTR